jgi:copper chaperone CopZ
MKKLLALLLLCLFLAGLVPFSLVNGDPAEAKAKKKIVRKVKKIKKKVRRIVKKKVRKVKKALKKKVKAKAVVKAQKQAAIKTPADSYSLPSRTGTVSQKYTLEEGIGDGESDKVVSELKGLGVTDASVDVDSNTLSVKFNSAELSSIGIIKKLKELGYTVKRIN